MTNANNNAGGVGAGVWTGRVLSGLTVAFLILASGVPKVIGHPSVAETMGTLGWPTQYAFAIGVMEIAIALLYAMPRTCVLGAVLMTGLLGAAMATHIRVGSPLFSHILFGFYMAVFAWGGLWLRLPQVRALLPLRR